jgi:WD40 repeat protein
MFRFKKKSSKSSSLVQAKAEAAACAARALLGDADNKEISSQSVTTLRINGSNPLLKLKEQENLELRARLQRRDQTVSYLCKEIELLRTGIKVMTEDLAVKEDQFAFLLSSLRDSATFLKQSQVQAEIDFDQRLSNLTKMERQVQERNLEVLTNMNSTHSSTSTTIVSINESEANLAVSNISNISNITNSTKNYTFLFHVLPFECREIVVSNLKFIDQGRCCCVNKDWNACHTESEVWFRGYHRYWDPECRQSSVMQSLHFSPAQRSGPMHSWKRMCQDRAYVESKWTSSRPLITTLVGHQGTVTCLGMVGINHMVSGSDDGSLRLWVSGGEKEERKEKEEEEEERKEKDTQSTANSSIHSSSSKGKNSSIMMSKNLSMLEKDLWQQHHRQTRPSRRIRAFQGHGGPVWCLQVSGSTLYSGSYDKCIKMWDINSGECMKTFRSHTGWVSCMDMMTKNQVIGSVINGGGGSGEILVSGSWDATIKLWRPDTGRLLKTITRENAADAVYCLKCDRRSSGQIAVGGRCPDVHILDVSSPVTINRPLRVFKGHCKPVNDLQIDTSSKYGRVVTGSSDTTVKIWDDRDSGSSQCVGTLNHGGAVMAVAQDVYKVISGCYDSTIRMFDLRRLSSNSDGIDSSGGRWKNCCVRTLEAHSGAIFSLMVNDDRNSITSGSADHTIKTFQFN